MKFFLFTLSLTLFISCNESKKPLTAQQIIDQAIKVSCHGNCNNATIEFSFRGKQYVSKRKAGNYTYKRIYNDSTSTIVEVLTNNEFTRYVNDVPVALSDTMAIRYSNSINSVHYFVQLPYLLNDKAVNKKVLEETTIKGEPYYQIAVHFDKEGGGTDFEDQYRYWIHKSNFTVDYLAYSYATGKGGIRFREAYHPREVEGIRFVDYNNYTPVSLDIALSSLPSMLENNQLKLLSKIKTENVTVTLSD